MKQFRSLFRNRNFVLHWLAGAISNVGDFFNGLALVKILSTDTANLGLYMSFIMIAKVLPGLVLGPVAGIVADRLPRRTVMIASDLLRAAVVLGLVFTDQPAVIITLNLVAACLGAFYNPASSALLPNIVRENELITAGSLSVMTQRMAMLIGNGLGAAVLMAVGPHNVFYIDAASFVLSALLLAGLVLPQAAARPAEGKGAGAKFGTDIVEALQYLRGARTVRNLFITFGIASVADAAMNVLLITFFTVGLGLAAENLGYVWAVFGGASLVGALAIGAAGDKVHWRHLVSGGATWVWVTVMGALLSRSVVAATSFLGLLGLGSGAINVGAQAAFGRLVPDKVRGRVFAGWGMLNSIIFIVGVLAAGPLSDRLGPTVTLMGFAAFYLMAGVYAFFAFRRVQAEAAPGASVAD